VRALAAAALTVAALAALWCAPGRRAAAGDGSDRAQGPSAPSTARAAAGSASISAGATTDPARSPPTSRAAALVDALGASDVAQVERAVAAIERIAAPESDPDALYAAARACEDKLLDPARAAALYERIVADHGAARVATMAARRVAALRELIGPRGETAQQAAELARLIATADALPSGPVIERGARLAAAAWPGAPAAALWLADWLRRTRRLTAAQDQYAAVVARWPGTPHAEAALRGGAGCAIEAHAWSLAEELASRLPVADAAQREVRDDLLAAAARGRRRARWYVAAWLAIAGALAALLGSLVEAIARSGRGARKALRPPIEVVFLAPVALVIVGVAFTAHRLIAPAVAAISAGGLALSWLSGAALDELRASGRPHRLRSVAQVAVCLVGIAALAYIALMRDALLDTVIETVRFGPEG
jgi:hypothetical protein